MNDKEKQKQTQTPIQDFQIPHQEHLAAPADWREDVERNDTPEDSTLRRLGETAVVARPEAEEPLEFSETELEELLKSRVVTEAWAIENGYTEAYPVEYRIFEPTDAPGYGGVSNRLAHVMLLGEDMRFVEKDGGFEPRLKLRAAEDSE